MYSTWFSVSPRGYCDRNFLREWASGLYFRGADSEECWDEIALEGVFELEFVSEVRLVSIGWGGGLGDLEGLLEWRDIVEGDLEDGNDESDVRRLRGAALPLELEVPVVSVVPVVPLVVGRCIVVRVGVFKACFVAFVLW